MQLGSRLSYQAQGDCVDFIFISKITSDCRNPGYENCDTLDEFVDLIGLMHNRVVFNHPGQSGQYGSDSFEQFNFPKTKRIVGMEMWNRDKDYYSRKGIDGVRYYDEALQKGWYIGAAGGQGKHRLIPKYHPSTNCCHRLKRQTRQILGYQK